MLDILTMIRTKLHRSKYRSYNYNLDFYPPGKSVAEKRKGTVDLLDRPFIGEQVHVQNQWAYINDILHTDEGIILVLEGTGRTRAIR